MSWASVDTMTNGSVGLDDFKIDVDATSGDAVAVSPRGFWTTLVKED